MILSGNGGDVSDESGKLESGAVGIDQGEVSFSIAGEYLSEAGIEASELGQPAAFIATHDQVGDAVAIEVDGLDGVDAGQLGEGGQTADVKLAMSPVEGDDGRGIVEAFDLGAVEHGLREEVMDGSFGIFGMAEVLLFERRDLVLHVAFEEDGHVLSLEGTGEYLVLDAVLVEVGDP